jgi:hypothetical protein
MAIWALVNHGSIHFLFAEQLGNVETAIVLTGLGAIAIIPSSLYLGHLYVGRSYRLQRSAILPIGDTFQAAWAINRNDTGYEQPIIPFILNNSFETNRTR